MYVYKNSLSIAEKTGDLRGLSTVLGNMGIIYDYKSDHASSLDCYYRSLKIAERLKDKKKMANAWGNMGLIYMAQKNWAKAKECYFTAIKIHLERGDTNASVEYGNIASMYYYQKKYDSACLYNLRALHIDKSQGNLNGVARHLGNIGHNLYEQAKQLNAANDRRLKKREDSLLTVAEQYYSDALLLRRKLGSKQMIASGLAYLSALESQKGKNNLAMSHMQEAIKLADEIHATSYQSEFRRTYSQMCEKAGKWKEAIENYKQYVTLRDSIQNEEATRQSLKVQMQYEFEKKAAADSMKNAEKKKLELMQFHSEMRNQKIYTWCGLGGVLIMFVVAFISFRAFRNKKRANIEIARQKSLVEEKQKEVMDSIYYARRIQRALITSERYIGKQLKRLSSSGTR